MSVFDPLDGWFEKGFRIRAQKAARTARDKVRARSGAAPSSTAGVKFSAGVKAKNATAIIKRAPEVVVKITGNNDGMASVKHHLEYISRNGEVELTDEDGASINGLGELKDLQRHYKAEQIPNESKKREFLHVVFSMPPGTPAKAMRESVREFCNEEFANRRWVIALHDDKDHTHVHLCVGTRDKDRADEPRLSPRKADLARWRLGIADKLRENGIDAAASERRHRFNYRRPEHAAIRQIRMDNPKSKVFDGRRAAEKAAARAIRAMQKPDTAFVGPLRGPRVPQRVQQQTEALQKALDSKRRPENPHAEAIERSRQNALSTWRKVESNLINAGQTDLAKHVASLIKQGETPVRSLAQERYDVANDRANDRAKTRSDEQGL